MNKLLIALGGIAVAAGVVTGARVTGASYFYNTVMKRDGVSTERSAKLSKTDWSKYEGFMQEGAQLLLARPHEEFSIKSYDGLKLHGTYFPAPEDAKRKKFVICFHGYTGEGVTNFYGYSHYYVKKGFGMLIPDARAHGKSEGTYIGFGCLDRHDALSWINWLIKKEGEDIDIILHGVSMGGATVLMASGLDLPPQVKGIISDCAFTSAKEVFSHVLQNTYHLPPAAIIPGANEINKKEAGYDMDECNSKREVAKAKVPILFIHGTADTFVPYAMCDEIYQCCSSEKRKFIVEGAAHAECYYKDTEGYEKAMDELMELAGLRMEVE